MTTIAMANAYEAGYCAFFEGALLSENPYLGSGAGPRWTLGWTHAELDHDQEMEEYQAVSEHDYRI